MGTAVARSVATVTAVIVVATGTVGALLTLGAFAAGTVGGSNVALRLRKERTHRKTIFAALLVDLDELDLHLVALLKTGGSHVGQTLP